MVKIFSYLIVSLMSYAALPPNGGLSPSGFGAISRQAGLVPPLCNCSACSLTSGFGPRRDPNFGTLAGHAGCDVGAPQGTTVLSPCNGTVKAAELQGGYGNKIDIECNVQGEKVVMRFAHLSKMDVSAGSNVTAGTKIGESGGQPGTQGAGKTTGPHLHYEVRKNDAPINPAPYFDPAKMKESCESLRQQAPSTNPGTTAA